MYPIASQKWYNEISACCVYIIALQLGLGYLLEVKIYLLFR